jgi:hypothetical protein
MKTLAQIEPRTPISSLPYAITNPGSYYLTANLKGISGSSGITISTNNVTLDLGGFTLQGVSGSSIGIFVQNTFTNLVFRNGTVTGWGGDGVNAYSIGYPRNMLFENLTVSANGGDGMVTEAGSIVRNCVCIGNTDDGFFSAGGQIIDCISRNNGLHGFSVNYAALHRCLSENNSTGFALFSSQALDCDCQNNSGDGFDCSGTSDEIRRCRIVSNGGDGIMFNAGNSGNVVEDCDIANNTTYGMYTSGIGGSLIAGNHFSMNTYGAIIISDSNNYIENNHIVCLSSTYGIAVNNSTFTNNVVAKNVVVGGGPGYNYSNIAGVSDFGPVGSAATATSPWANISH